MRDKMNVIAGLKKARKAVKKFLTTQQQLDSNLFEFVKAGDIAKVKAAVEDGANPSFASSWKEENPLLFSIEAGNIGMVRALLELKSDPNAKMGYYGNTPFLSAARKGDVAIVAAMLEAKADVNAVSENGTTAFLLAAAARSKPQMDLLIEKGAKTDVFNREGWSALSYAVRNGDVETITLLLARGARTDRHDDEGRSLLDIARESDKPAAFKAIQAHLDTLMPKWQKLEDADEIAHVSILWGAGYKLTEVFNMRTRRLTAITHNFETGRDETVTRGFADGDKTAIAEAAEELADFKAPKPAVQTA